MDEGTNSSAENSLCPKIGVMEKNDDERNNEVDTRKKDLTRETLENLAVLEDGLLEENVENGGLSSLKQVEMQNNHKRLNSDSSFFEDKQHRFVNAKWHSLIHEIVHGKEEPSVVEVEADEKCLAANTTRSSFFKRREAISKSHESLQEVENNQNNQKSQQVSRSNMRTQSIGESNDKNDRIIINVGGTRHESFRSTLRMYPDTRLGWIAMNGSECIDAYDSKSNEYFFDRHPTAFSQIINFYRTGKLHAPTGICGPLFEEELIYWGLDEKSMEPCCWSKYTEHRDAQESLKVFETPLLNLNEEELNVETMYDQHVAKKENEGSSSKFSGFYNRCKPSIFNSNKWFHIKKCIWVAFEDRSPKRSMLSKVLSIVSLTFIVLSVLSLCFHSMVLLAPNSLYEILLFVLDVITFTWFTVEFLLRFIASPKRLTFLSSITNIFDLLAIVTYPVQFSKGFSYYKGQNSVVEIFSSMRLFRLFRFFRLSLGLQILKHTLIASSKELLLLMLLLIIPVAILATFTYYSERKVADTKFTTIPESIWWAIITITTVGYGDMSPLTTVGKVFGIVCAICSVVILSLPVSIIGNNFSLFYHYAQARMKLPKRPKLPLVGAANALVAEVYSETQEESEDEKNTIPQINFHSDPDLNANLFSKRFRNGHVSKATDESQSESETECNNVFQPVTRAKTATTTVSFAGNIIKTFENNAFDNNEVVDRCNTDSSISSKDDEEQIKRKRKEETSKTERLQTVVIDVENKSVMANKHFDTANNKLRNIIVSTPPIIPKSVKNENSREVKVNLFRNETLDGLTDHKNRKRSNNHLYPPTVADKVT